MFTCFKTFKDIYFIFCVHSTEHDHDARVVNGLDLNCSVQLSNGFGLVGSNPARDDRINILQFLSIFSIAYH